MIDDGHKYPYRWKYQVGVAGHVLLAGEYAVSSQLAPFVAPIGPYVAFFSLQQANWFGRYAVVTYRFNLVMRKFQLRKHLCFNYAKFEQLVQLNPVLLLLFKRTSGGAFSYKISTNIFLCT